MLIEVVKKKRVYISLFDHVCIVYEICHLNRMHPPMIAVGSDDNNPSGGGKCQVFEYNDSTRCVPY